MQNNVLTITVRNKVPSVQFGEYLISENTGYRLRFDFDAEWDSYHVKIVHFNMDGWHYEKQFTGNEVSVPLLPSDITEVSIGVIAGDLTTTSAVTVPVYDSILSAAQPTSAEDAAEMARVRAEAERAAAELARAAAEAERVTAENARIVAENARASAETARVSAENLRVSHENSRASAENARISAETARASAESGRAAAENARVSHENTRMSSETARMQNEQDRSAAETIRVSNENKRIENETARVTAELARISAESARDTAEQGRTAAETARAQAETARQSAELLRVAAESERETAMTNFMNTVNAYASANDVFNVPYLIGEYGTRAAFRQFAQANAPLDGLTNTTLRFFAAASASVTDTYTSQFYKYTANSTPNGVKKDANANLVCEPSTAAEAGRDDYKDLPLFACFDCNYTIDADTLEPVIHSIKDVYGAYSSAPSDSLVGVIQMTGWVKRTTDSTTKTVEYTAYRKDTGFKPLPEAVRASNNSIRPYVIHAKYAAGYNSLGKLSSVSGVQPATKREGSAGSTAISHDSQIAKWQEWGSQYGGSSICDVAFCQLMLEIKYACLASSNIMAGCSNFGVAYTAAATETGVKRVILTQDQADAFPIGCSVSAGSGSARNESSCYNVCDITKVTAKENVTVNGTGLVALILDASRDFNVLAGETYVVSQPWQTGATDEVRGNDGSPYNNQSGKEPCKIQGIELMLGVSEALGDTTFIGSSGTNTFYCTRLAANARSESIGVSACQIGTMSRSGSSGWRYIRELNWTANDMESYMIPKSTSTSASLGYCSAAYLQAQSTSSQNTMAWIAYGHYASDGYAGIACANLVNTASNSSTLFACRACGTAGNRGNYSANSAIG